jgi:hypothetical protein
MPTKLDYIKLKMKCKLRIEEINNKGDFPKYELYFNYYIGKKINLLTDLILSIQLINTTDTKIPEYHYKCIFDKIDNLDTNDETTIEFLTDFIQFNIELFTI